MIAYQPRGWLWRVSRRVVNEWRLFAGPIEDVIREWRYSRLTNDKLLAIVRSDDRTMGESIDAARELKRRGAA